MDESYAWRISAATVAASIIEDTIVIVPSKRTSAIMLLVCGFVIGEKIYTDNRLKTKLI